MVRIHQGASVAPTVFSESWEPIFFWGGRKPLLKKRWFADTATVEARWWRAGPTADRFCKLDPPKPGGWGRTTPLRAWKRCKRQVGGGVHAS